MTHGPHLSLAYGDFFLRNIGIRRYELDGLVGATIWDANPSRRRKAWEGAEFG